MLFFVVKYRIITCPDDVRSVLFFVVKYRIVTYPDVNSIETQNTFCVTADGITLFGRLAAHQIEDKEKGWEGLRDRGHPGVCDQRGVRDRLSRTRSTL